MDRACGNIKPEDLHSTYQMLARIIGLEAAVKLGRELNRSTIYFPELRALTVSRREVRDKMIIEDHKSGQYTKEQLGRKYNMTAVGITSVLRRAKAESATSKNSGDELIEEIMRALSELDEESKREVLRYTIKRRNSSRA